MLSSFISPGQDGFPERFPGITVNESQASATKKLASSPPPALRADTGGKLQLGVWQVPGGNSQQGHDQKKSDSRARLCLFSGEATNSGQRCSPALGETNRAPLGSSAGSTLRASSHFAQATWLLPHSEILALLSPTILPSNTWLCVPLVY